jgi:DNA-directed RNA polymerase specialized sigma24 family protein
MTELDRAYKDFFKKLEKENPKEYQWFKDQEKKQRNIYNKEIPCPPERINYLVNKKQELAGINNTWIQTYRAKLTKKQAEVFRMYYIDRLIIDEISNILDCSIRNVYYIIRNINRRLKRKQRKKKTEGLRNVNKKS